MSVTKNVLSVAQDLKYYFDGNTKSLVCSDKFFTPLHAETQNNFTLLYLSNNAVSTKYHTTNKCTNCMSFILNQLFKTLFIAPTCFDNLSLIIIREHI